MRTPMAPTRHARFVAVAIATLALSACSWDCGTASHTVAIGTVRDPSGTVLATAQADLMENVGPAYLQLSVGVVGSANSWGAPLKGHVTRARLMTEADELLAEIPTGTETLFRDAVVGLPGLRLSGAEYDRVRSALLSTRAKVVLDTDLPGLEHLETRLDDAHELPADVQRCSPA